MTKIITIIIGLHSSIADDIGDVVRYPLQQVEVGEVYPGLILIWWSQEPTLPSRLLPKGYVGMAPS